MLEKLPEVNVKLSWKQKLTMVIAITLIGLLGVTISAFVGLNSVNSSFEKQKNAVEYKQNSLAMINSLLKLDAAGAALRTGNTEKFITDLKSLNIHISYMQRHSSALGYEELNEFANKLLELTSDYIAQRKAWVENRKELGFTSEEGKLVTLINTLSVLEKIPSVIISKPIGKMAALQRKYLITKDKENEAEMEKLTVKLKEIMVQYNWDKYPIGKKIKAYLAAFEGARGLIRAEQKILSTMIPLNRELVETVEKQNQFLEETVINQVAIEANNAGESAMRVISIAAIVVGLISLFSLGNIARQLNIQLSHMQAFLKSIAEGDFSKNLATNNNEKDEFTQLRVASNHMVHDISGVISQVVDGNKSLMVIREQLDQAVGQLGISSEEVEQKTQQSTVATQQISIAVNDVAKRSVDVSETAQTASQATKTGGKVIADCVNSMINIVELIQKTHDEVSHLSQSSSKMLGIIDVINGLADQTNLLALNAAIESARAGEAGRGFSVVADEVRALAQKTVNATSSIGDIIKGFNDQSKRMGCLMEEGISLASSGQENANNAKTSFETIENSIQKVAAEMDQVVVAVEEISYNTNDIATQIEHIFTQGEATKETRLTMEDHAHELSSQAETLEQLTGRFKLSDL